MAIEWALSADKHHIPHEDALHAMMHSVIDTDVVPQTPGRPVPTVPQHLFIGPPAEGSSRLLEVIVERRSGGNFYVFHVMELGSKYRRWMEQNL